MLDYIQGWFGAREIMLFGPSGYHFGHAKSVCTNWDLADNEEMKTNIPYTSGNLLKQWHQGTNCMILRIPGKLESG